MIHHRDILRYTTPEFCFLCNRATDHTGEHEDDPRVCPKDCPKCNPPPPRWLTWTLEHNDAKEYAR